MKFNAKSTLYIKGIAIILMVCNHLFPIPEWIYSENQFISIPLGSKTLAAYFGGFSKICVSIFAFLTGIAMYYTYSKKSIGEGYKHTLKKLLPFFLTYWTIIICIYIPVMATAGVFSFDIREFLLNLTGYVTTYCKVAWYVRFYLELILTFPLVVLAANFIYKRCGNKEISIGSILVVNWLLRTTISFFKFPGVQFVIEYMNCFPVVIAGYYMAWTSMFERVSSWISEKIKSKFILLEIYFILFGGIFLTRGLLTGNGLLNIDVILAPVFIESTWYVLKSLEKIKIIQNVENTLAFLGKYSLEIWFLHAIFFIGNARVQSIAYWPKIDILILAWTLLFLTPFAVIIQRLQRKVLSLIH